MRILALDAAEYRVGWALGEAGLKPDVGCYRLRRKDERTEEAVERYAVWLDNHLLSARRNPPFIDLVVIEPYISPGVMAGFTSAAVAEGAILLNGATRAICAVHSVPVRAPAISTVRVHFCGQMSAAPRRPIGHKRTSKERDEDRAATKKMVLDRAKRLGYLPEDCMDDNMADAAAIFDFASSHWGRKAAAFELVGQ